MSASLCCLLSIGLLVIVSADQKSVTAESGQNVTLICRAPNNKKIITVEWQRPDLHPKYVLLFRNRHIDPENQHPSFVNRVDLQDKQMKDGDVSLILKNVTSVDTGTYECRVFLEETRSLQSITNINLHVVVPPDQKTHHSSVWTQYHSDMSSSE
ncbi:selection and upkeep of intraepithelial T-cells protein 7-like isoform X2 [Oreochromis niloticus]|uniref:selection and upkeep of intraepithelial T-cells protein 7-like isoform X2 n=1 Tax=Oreochromis niloticus TaxID=8128 RepID=UPI000DF21940|nr:selection and upkeep of intraepithelial T-cells protein 7-like isoform X2 [Oreochromis niloticus]